MKNITFILIAITLASCVEYSQVISTKPLTNDIKAKQSYYVYDDDTLNITYSFWGAYGLLQFSVYNKLDKPIYIDWSKSSFVYRNEKRSYYRDRQTISSLSVHKNTTEITPVPYTPVLSSYGATVTSATAVQEERITFIPPQSAIVKSYYSIANRPSYFSTKDNNTEPGQVDKAPVYITYYGPQYFVFRNFLTYSMNDDFRDEHYINNGFYVDSVLTMKSSYFGITDVQGNTTYPFKSNNRFYIRGISRGSVYRKF